MPFALIVRFSLLPDDNTSRATPAAAAALLICRPVALEAVELSTFRAGLVEPFKPTARLFALALVMIAELPKVEAPVTARVLLRVAAPVTPRVVPTVRAAEAVSAPVTASVLLRVAAPVTARVLLSVVAPVIARVLWPTIAPLAVKVVVVTAPTLWEMTLDAER